MTSQDRWIHTPPRPSATFDEFAIAEIRRAAATGIYDIRGFGAKRRLPHFDDLLFLGASVSRYPLEGYRDKCGTDVTIGTPVAKIASESAHGRAKSPSKSTGEPAGNCAAASRANGSMRRVHSVTRVREKASSISPRARKRPAPSRIPPAASSSAPSGHRCGFCSASITSA